MVRGGQPVDVPTSQIVRGDVAWLGPGDRVPADLRLLETAALRVDESSLTGESVPVTKQADLALAPAAELGDRQTMAYAGTLVTADEGRGVAVATGPAAELGRIVQLVEEAREPRTLLQTGHARTRRLAGLGGDRVQRARAHPRRAHCWSAPQGDAPRRAHLAFATIPEELPILITIVPGLGAQGMQPGAAIAFLIAGPVTTVPAMSAVWGSSGPACSPSISAWRLSAPWSSGF